MIGTKRCPGTRTRMYDMVRWRNGTKHAESCVKSESATIVFITSYQRARGSNGYEASQSATVATFKGFIQIELRRFVSISQNKKWGSSSTSLLLHQPSSYLSHGLQLSTFKFARPNIHQHQSKGVGTTTLKTSRSFLSRSLTF